MVERQRHGLLGDVVLCPEVAARHAKGYPKNPAERSHRRLEVGGEYQWRREGEIHLFNPESIHRLQKAVRTGSYETFKAYSSLVNDQAANLCTLRGLLEFKADPKIATNFGDTALTAAGGIGWVPGVTYERSPKENVEAIRMLLDPT